MTATQTILDTEVTESPRTPATFDLLNSLNSGLSDATTTVYEFSDRGCRYIVRHDLTSDGWTLSGSAIKDVNLERATVTVDGLESAVRYVRTHNLWTNEYGDDWLLYPFAG